MRDYLPFTALITALIVPIPAACESARGTPRAAVDDTGPSACLPSPSARCVFSIAERLARADIDACSRVEKLLITATAEAQAGFQESAKELTIEATRTDGCVALQENDPMFLVRVADAQLRTGDEREAGAALQAAIQTASRTDDWSAQYTTEYRTWEAIADIAVRLDDIAHAAGLPRQIDDPFIVHDLLEKMARLRLQRGDIPGTLGLVAAIRFEVDRRRMLEKLAKAQAARGDLIGALAILERIHDGGHYGWTVKEIVHALAIRRDLTAFLTAVDRAARQMEDGADRARTLAAVAVAYADAGKLAQAKEMLAEVILAAGQADDRDRGRQSVAIAHAATGDLAEALRTIGQIGDRDRKNWVRADLAALQAKAGNSQDAARLVNDIPADWWAREDVLADVAARLAAAGDLAEAIRTVGQVGHPLMRSVMLADIAEAHAATGDFAGALLLADHLPHETVQHHRALRNIALAQYQAGDPGAAAETLTFYAETRGTTDDLMHLAAMQGAAGNYAAAARIIEQMDDPEDRDLITFTTIVGLPILDEYAFAHFVSFDSAHHLRAQVDLAPALRFAERLLDTDKRLVALLVIGSAAAR